MKFVAQKSERNQIFASPRAMFSRLKSRLFPALGLEAGSESERSLAEDSERFPPVLEDPDFQPILNSFRQNLPIRIAELLDAINRGATEESSRLAHRLKGSAGLYGFLELSNLCRELERGIAAGEDLSELIDQLASHDVGKGV